MTSSNGRHYPDDLPRHSVSAGAVIREDGRDPTRFWRDQANQPAPPNLDSPREGPRGPRRRAEGYQYRPQW